MKKQDSLSIFHPLIQKWFKEKVGQPTDIQNQSWPVIADDKHVLISAPTGSGKTLTAFLWAINQLITGIWPVGKLRILYISPLKALNNDVQKNLIAPLDQLDQYFHKEKVPFPSIRVLTRSGDTPSNERQKMLRRPPEILITTPESLNIILTSKNSRHILSGITTVILDEIHAVVAGKRGTHLITAVDRLVPLCGEFQRIALSATVKPMQRVADFVGGYIQTDADKEVYRKRHVVLIQSKDSKTYQVKVCFPENAREQIRDASWWPPLINEFKKIIKQKRSTLLFSNSRRSTEKVTRYLNEDENEDLAYSHHSSLSKEIRLAIEQRLKKGELRAIVATNSLELGIDIGELDQVILIQTPFSISSAVQRIGRSGHKVGEISEGLIFPTHGRDFLDAAVMAKTIVEKDIEEVHPVKTPLDVLAQIILSMTSIKEWDIDKLYYFIKTSYPYQNLSRRQYDLVLEMLAGLYADSRMRELRPRLSIDKIDNKIKAKQGTLFLLYMSGGTIPDRGYYNLRLQDSKEKIGELDEEFVWERNIGETFALGNQLWRVQKITANDIEVVPSRDRLNIIPFWRAEERDRGFYFSEKILDFLREANDKLYDRDFYEKLMDQYYMQGISAEELIHFLKRQKEATKTDLPHRQHILIEHFDDPLNKSESKQVIIHTLWGYGIIQPFSIALSAAWEERYKYPLQVIANNDALLLMLPHDFSIQDIFSMITPENIEHYLRKKLEKTGYFGAHFRENAGRALLLPRSHFNKRMPLWLNRLRSKKLYKSVLKYQDFPILLETWRTCLQDEFDLEHLKQLLDEIQNGEIKISEVITHTASPFSDNLIWKQTNKYMYEDDTPLDARHSDLKDDLIKEVLSTSHLLPRISKEIINILDVKLKRTAPGYSPVSFDDLLDWIKERLLIPVDQWKDLIASVIRDSQEKEEKIKMELSFKVIWINLPGVKHAFLCAVEVLPKIVKVFQIPKEKLSYKPIIENKETLNKVNQSIKKIFLQKTNLLDDEYSLSNLLDQWLVYYGPVSVNYLNKTLGIQSNILNESLELLIEADSIIKDKITEESEEIEICNRENLEILLRMLRKQRQPSFKALSLEKLPLFLASFQGLLDPGYSVEELQSSLEQLFGWNTPAEAWEEFILPCRLEPYYEQWLDSVMQSSDLIWFGYQKGKVGFCFYEDLELYKQNSLNKKEKETITQLFPDKRARYAFSDIMSNSGLNSADTAETLWQYTWKSIVTNDSFITIRKGLLNKFKPDRIENEKRTSRRSGFNRWESTRPVSGNWYILADNDKEYDVLEESELIKDRIRQLFKRYGILFRELLYNELPLLQWKSIIRILRLMEFSGEIVSGHFFNGIKGLQFISHEALRLIQRPLDEDQIFWINAVDPASLCGVDLEDLKHHLPRRVSSNFLVYHGSRLVITACRNGRDLSIHVESDNTHIKEYLSFFKVILKRSFNPLKKIVVEKINDIPAIKSEYAETLRSFGFKKTYKSLELWTDY